MSEPAKRINRSEEIDDSVPCYWKWNDVWHVYLPSCGIGKISGHSVVEHEDGTISVTPSILMTGHKEGEQTQRHGYLTNGVWNEC